MYLLWERGVMGSLNLCPMLLRYVWAEQRSPQLFVVDCSHLVLAVVGPLWSHSFTGVSHQEKGNSGLVGRRAPRPLISGGAPMNASSGSFGVVKLLFHLEVEHTWIPSAAGWKSRSTIHGSVLPLGGN